LQRMDLCQPAPAGHEVLTVHDLACPRFPDEGELRPPAAESARRATAMVTDSESTTHRGRPSGSNGPGRRAAAFAWKRSAGARLSVDQDVIGI
jgi:hypothetical protein